MYVCMYVWTGSFFAYGKITNQPASTHGEHWEPRVSTERHGGLHTEEYPSSLFTANLASVDSIGALSLSREKSDWFSGTPKSVLCLLCQSPAFFCPPRAVEGRSPASYWIFSLIQVRNNHLGFMYGRSGHLWSLPSSFLLKSYGGCLCTLSFLVRATNSDNTGR